MTKKNSSVTSAVFVGALVVLALVALVPGAWATNGYFTHGYGTTSKGLAGAGVALAQDALVVGTNPAGLVFLGKEYYAGLSIFSPNRQYTVEGNPSGFPGTFGLTPGTVESDSNYFYIPALGFNWMIDENSSYGLTMYGHGGMNTDYPASTFYGSSPTGVDFSQLFIVNSYSRKVGERHAFGLSLITAYQRFEASGIQAFGGFSSDPSALSNNGHDASFGFGFKVGYQGEVADGFFLGASYQSKLSMDEFSDYAGLFAEQGGFDVPSTYTVGLAWQMSDAFTLAIDFQEIMYSDIASVNNPFLPNIATSLLGHDDGAGFGWQDMTVYKVGLQWRSSDAWTWRFGFSTGDQPIPPSEVLFNILAPGVMEDHYTVGFSRAMGSNNLLHFALMYAPSVSVIGENPLEVPGLQTIELEMDQWELELSYSWKF